MSSHSLRYGSGRARRLSRILFGILLAGFAHSLQAQPAVTTDGPGTFAFPVFGPPGISAEFNGNYGSVTVSGTGNETTSYPLNATFVSNFFTLSGTTTPGAYQLTSNSGSISNGFVGPSGPFRYEDAAGAEFGKIGNGAIRLIAQPAPFEPSKGIGGDITWNAIPLSLIVEGNGTTTTPAPTDTLSPGGFRMAQLSGIAAISYGDQAVTNGPSMSGGNVTVNGTATIAMSNTDPNQITAGISAASATGPGTSYGDNGPATVTTTLTNGTISNSAESGIGMMAVATGAQFLPGTSDVAYGGNVSATLTNSAITLTGTTGIGIFAASEVYVASEPPKNSTVQAGTVTVFNGTTGAPSSSITVGEADSIFSMGILAVSAGQDLFLNPYASQQVNGHGLGNAGAVEVSNYGSVTTQGLLSSGIVGLSIGGAGIVTTNSGAAGQASALGNSGGLDTDGVGTAVTITNDGTINTVGANAYGVVALSTGGGGILNNDIDVIADANGVATSGLVVGNDSSQSSSSKASVGGTIIVTNSGTISTGDGNGTGVAAMGIVAQSIGGGGGNAGGNHAALFVGDKGGAGGAGGATTVDLNAGSLLTTMDENSIGVLAQSIGGGGGNGGNAKGIFVAVGGNGGAGGAGGTITIDVGGTLNTLDDYSAGVIAQSVGGGGGHGGTATAVGIGAAFGLGGNGGSGGAGGAVTGSVDGGGLITTVGNNSTALHLQSVGGGGGTGGAAIAKSGEVGTGEGVTLDFNLAVGGSGGTGGAGAAVSGTNSGVITTGVVTTGSSNGAPNMDGADSYGMLAQSIGGGGGQGGLATAKSIALNLSGTEGGTVNPDDPEGAEVDPAPVSDTTTLTITIGANVADSGSGGHGGNGGTAGLTNLGTVTTYGDGSTAMIAQSIGAGGGSGGDSTAASALSAATGNALTIGINLGGNGGTAGSGGGVTLTNSGPSAVIQTYGQSAVGMQGQSIGGGGGNAAMGNSGTSNLHTPTTGTNSADTAGFSFSLGGSGGAGGDAGSTTLENDGLISTAGSGAMGILAQSIGGGGGNASGGASDGSNNKLTIDVSVGGNGGSGGNATGTNSFGYSVMASNFGTIHTIGGDATGIVAQSIGGGGGNGGSADAKAAIGAVGSITNTLFSGTSYQSNITLGAAVGGSGGKGGQGGGVYVEQDGTLSTSGFQSHGILAQSISGGGGKGGAATAQANPGLFDGFNSTLQFGALVAVGGKGGDGHAGGTVTVLVDGETTTAGYGAHAVVAQSIGGGGGLGADGTADVTSSIGLGFSVNEYSGTLGAGGSAYVALDPGASFSTTGGDASGIVVQSISGGGIASTGQDRHLLTGDFGAGVLPVHLDFTLGVNLNSSDAADGGSVAVYNPAFTEATTQIDTQGDFSHGMVAQSIGAGGGKASAIFGTDAPTYADFSGTITQVVSGTSWTSRQGINLGATKGNGSGGSVNITAETEISTGQSGSTGYGAYGILAQSIGGGGGLATVDTAAANGIVTLGGTTSASGVGGHGGQVYMDYTGGVTTQGEAAHAVVLQSIGGGGGVAIIGSSREWSGTAPPSGQQVDMTLGSHNSFGAGQTVTADTTLSIATSGENAFGFVAQSIGGGGGIATSRQGGEVSLGMQAAGTDSYNGSTVSLNQSLQLTTSGVGSHGVVAQSIGGGGGIANPSSTGGLTTTPALTNSGTALGYGGAVNVTVTGTIQTSGAGAYGLIAQTISGGGGLTGNFAGSTGGVHSTGSVGSGTAGNVSVTTDAHIVSSGSGSTAIFAQNATAGDKGAGSVTLSISGNITGGSGPGAQAIWVDGGNSANSITIQSGAAVSAASRQAIQYTGLERVDVTNYGAVYGSVSLSDSSSTQGIFTNEGVASFFAEGDINATVNDYGSLFIGTSNDVGATATFSGTYTQFSTGTVVMDIIDSADYDQMLFAGSGYGDFGDEIQIRLSMDYNPVVGDTFQLIGAGSGGTNLLSSSWATTSNNGFVEVGLWNGTSLIPLWDGVEWETTVGADSSYTFAITHVPEPGAAMLVLLGAGGLLLRRTRGTRFE